MSGPAKFNFGQFGLLSSRQLETPYGNSSPIGLLWRLMAASPGHQIVAVWPRPCPRCCTAGR
ncbi:hypothetical protein [Deinococcus hopiensis]|uniref:hypothetical protein n=1 Tax=Deinococcus hopiensis TaxID=309885 RepID=UPI001483154F|nr:hypothetical protein [Deinococcus hopiensis]